MNYVYRKRTYRALFSVIDGIGSILFGIIRIFCRKRSQPPQKILIIRLDHIGDVVMATSVIAPLRRAFPASRIDFMAPSWAGEMLEQDPNVNNVISFDASWFSRKASGGISALRAFYGLTRVIRKGGYDAVIDLRGDARHIAAIFMAGVKRRISYGITGFGFLLTDQVPYKRSSHEIDRDVALLEVFRVSAYQPAPKLYYSKEIAERIENIRKKEGIDKPYAVIHFVAGREEKNWTVEGFAGVIEYLAESKGLIPVIIGGKEDVLYIKGFMDKVSQKVIDLCGMLNLSELVPFFEGASLFIGLDSGPSHIAAATGIPTVILFSGVNDPDEWAPRGGNVRVIFPGKGKGLEGVSAGEVIGVIEQRGKGERQRGKR